MSVRGTRRALVTGAAQGIGAAIAAELAAQGYEVIAVDRDEERLAQTYAAKSTDEVRVVPLVCDLADTGSIEELWASAEGIGEIDILVNNAAVTHLKPLWDITLAEWEEVVAVNQRAVFWLSRLAGKPMAARGWGRIVNVASLAGQAARPSGAHYAATKGAVIALTRVFAAELAGGGVTVNAVSPGTIQSAMTDRLEPGRLARLRAQIPVGRLGQGSDIASAVAYLISEEAGFVTGTSLDLNGGVLMR